MKTSLKRIDSMASSHSTDKSAQKEMSELLEMRCLLDSKLAILTKSIDKDVSSFVSKNLPEQGKDFHLLDLENNLLGTNRNFFEFSSNFKALFHSIESDIKGVVQVLEKFSVTRNLSFFITEGILDNFIKLNNLMFNRQEHFQKVMHILQQNLMSGKGLFSSRFAQSAICTKCQFLIEKQNIAETKQSMLFGGQRICNFFKQNVQKNFVIQSDEDEYNNNWIGAFYDRIKNIKRKVKNSVNGDGEMIKEEEMKFTLDKLQNNLEQRKYDILACLIEMGQFWTELNKSFTNQGKSTQIKQAPNNGTSLPNSIQQLPELTSLIPKFNYQKFTLNIGKHFCKEIKDLESELQKIKSKYSNLLSSQMPKVSSQQTQCNLVKDIYEKELTKQKLKTEKQLGKLREKIEELELANEELSEKLESYEQVVKNHVGQSMSKGMMGVQMKIMETNMRKLTDDYQKRLKQKDNEIVKLKNIATNSAQTISDQNESQKKQPQNNKNSVPISSSQQTNCHIAQQDKYKIQKSLHFHKQQRSNKKKISLFLQPIMKKLYDKQMPTNSFQQSSANIGSRIFSKEMNNSSAIYQNATQLMTQNGINVQTAKMIESIQVIQNYQINKLSLNKQLISITIQPQNLSNSYNQEPKQILNNTPLVQSKRPFLPLKLRSKHKLLKVKSQQDQKFNKLKDLYSYEDRINIKMMAKNQGNAQLKRYVSESCSYPGQKPINNKKISKEKTSNKNSKTLSLKIVKKVPNQQQDSIMQNSLKLPSLSQYDKPTLTKHQNTKTLQKLTSPQKNTSSLLNKKKRKKRHFSQEFVGTESLFENSNNMTASLGGQQLKVKKKKEYIIDFIPKVEEDSIQICREYEKLVQDGINALFDLDNHDVSLKMNLDKLTMKEKKPKTYSKTCVQSIYQTSDQQSPSITTRLLNYEISLSTKLYSILASIKLSNFSLYQLIKQSLTKHYLDKKNKKTTDNYGINSEELNEPNEANKNYMPVSLAVSNSNRQLRDSSFKMRKKRTYFQTVSTTSNQLGEGDIQSKEVEETEMRKIINFIIVSHRKSCGDEQESHKENTQHSMCKHISQFYQFLVECNNRKK